MFALCKVHRAGDHEYEECTAGTQLKCCSCGGAHSVTFGGCSRMKQEVEVQKVRVLENKSYAEGSKVKVVRKKGEIQGAVGGGGEADGGGIKVTRMDHVFMLFFVWIK